MLTIPAPVSTTALASGLTGVVAALEAASLVKTIDSTSDLTIFAPNDDAFKKVSAQVSKLSAEQLADVLGYHGQRSYASVRRPAANIER